jgi:hypothetical protein
MNCLRCQTELIHGGDHDVEENEDFSIVSNLSCPECQMFYLAYTPEDNDE